MIDTARTRLAFLTLTAFALGIAHPSSARILRVPTQQATVRAAVDAAAGGDTILIAPGIHAGGVFITGKAVTLASWFLTTQDTNYIAQTVIDTIVGQPCNGTTSCAGNAVLEFASDASGSAVIGLTIRRGEDGVRSRAVMDLAWCRITRNADGVDYQNGAGGTIRNNVILGNHDDGIDLNGAIHGVVRDNIVRDNHQDGVEFRLYAYSGPVVQVDFLRNRFIDNGGDGIQLIDYPDASSRVIRIEGNLFSGTLDAAVGCMPDGQTGETFVGAPIAERVYLISNTFVGGRYGFVGGANVIALNNVFTGIQASALRRVGGNSITSYSLFWNNGVDHEESVLDLPHLLHADPLLTAAHVPGPGSPAIDAGTAFFQWQGATVLDLPTWAYQGTAPDMGAFEGGGDPDPPPPPPPPTGSFERRIATGADDAEESATGTVDLSSSDLELVNDGSNQTVGLRFTDVAIPQGATISAAYVQFETDEAKSEATNLVIRGQAADHAAAFASAAGNLSTRAPTAASVGWAPAAWTVIGEAGANQRTPDLRAAIQEIVSRPGWASGNALAILFTGTGRRTARAFEGRAAGAALLHVDLGSGDPPPPPVNTAPVVNAGPDRVITLPAGAALDGTVSDDGLPSPPALATTWSQVSGPGAVTFGDAAAVDTQAGFPVEGTYVLQLAASDGALGASDQVQVTVLAAPPPGPGTIDRRITAGSDDAEESATAKVSTTNSDIELVFDRSSQRVGLRFTAVTIPAGAAITRAWIQLAADEVQSEATSLLVQGQAADDPATFTTVAGNVSTRPRTTASVTWTPPAWTLVGEAGANQRTPDLVEVVREIVARPGWASGNAMVFIVTGTGRRTAESFEGKAAAAALLHVEYDTSAPAANAGGGVAACEAPELETMEIEAPASEAPAGETPGIEAPRVEFALRAVSPNPTRGSFRVEFSLAGSEPATLELLDVAGRRVAAREVGDLGAGRHRAEWKERLPAGVYLVRLAQGRRAQVMKAVVVR